MALGEGNVAIRMFVGLLAIVALVILLIGAAIGFGVSSAKNEQRTGNPPAQVQGQAATTVVTTVVGTGTLQVSGKGSVRVDANPAADIDGARAFDVKQSATVELKSGTVTFVNINQK